MPLDIDESAYDKWCPFAQRMRGRYHRPKDVFRYDEGSANTTAYSSAATHGCLQKACMAWRWAEPDPGHADRQGYCGLVGKPEFE